MEDLELTSPAVTTVPTTRLGRKYNDDLGLGNKAEALSLRTLIIV